MLMGPGKPSLFTSVTSFWTAKQLRRLVIYNHTPTPKWVHERTKVGWPAATVTIVILRHVFISILLNFNIPTSCRCI